MKNIFKIFIVIISCTPLFSMANISVIVHPSNQTKISKSDIKKLFLGKKTTFSDGSLATPVNLMDSGEVRELFNKRVLSRSSSQVARVWSKIEFTSTGKLPRYVSTEEMLTLIANNPEMIGYVLSKTVSDDVKVVLTIKF
jgi:ABC-type phosphate transport system substrate-binding protein